MDRFLRFRYLGTLGAVFLAAVALLPAGAQTVGICGERAAEPFLVLAGGNVVVGGTTAALTSTVLSGGASGGVASGLDVLAANGSTPTGLTTLNGILVADTIVDADNAESPNGANSTAFADSDAAIQAALTDLQAFKTALNGLCGSATVIPSELGGQNLVPGVYRVNGAATLTGVLTLSGVGDFVICADSLTSGTGGAINTVAGANPANVFINLQGTGVAPPGVVTAGTPPVPTDPAVGAGGTFGANIGAGNTINGNIIASGNISLGAGTAVTGYVQSTAGNVTLNNNTIRNPVVFGNATVANFDAPDLFVARRGAPLFAFPGIDPPSAEVPNDSVYRPSPLNAAPINLCVGGPTFASPLNAGALPPFGQDSFVVTGDEDDPQFFTLSAVGVSPTGQEGALPPGTLLLPALPITVTAGPEGAPPAGQTVGPGNADITTVVVFRPTAPGQYAIRIIATDQAGVRCTFTQRYNVAAAPTITFGSPGTGTTAAICSAPNVPVSVPITVTGATPGSLVQVTGANVVGIPGVPGAVPFPVTAAFNPPLPPGAAGSPLTTSFQFTPGPGNVGQTFQQFISATDFSTGCSVTQRITITVTDPPTVTVSNATPNSTTDPITGNITINACPGQTVTATLAADDPNTNENAILSVGGAPAGASFSPNLNGNDSGTLPFNLGGILLPIQAAPPGQDILAVGTGGNPATSVLNFPIPAGTATGAAFTMQVCASAPAPGDPTFATPVFNPQTGLLESVSTCTVCRNLTVNVVQGLTITGPTAPIVACPGVATAVPAITATGPAGEQVTLNADPFTGGTFAPAIPAGGFTGTGSATTGALTFSPTVAAGQNVTVTFRATSPSCPSVTLPVLFQVTNAPVIAAPALITTCPGEAESIPVSATDADAGQQVTLAVSTTPVSGAAPPAVALSGGTNPGNPATGNLTFTATADSEFDIVLTATDSGTPTCTTTQTIRVQVSNANAPVFVAPTPAPGIQPAGTTSFTINTTGGTAPVTVAATSTCGTVTPAGPQANNTVFTFVANAGSTADCDVTLTATGADGCVATRTITIPGGQSGPLQVGAIADVVVCTGDPEETRTVTVGNLGAGETIASVTTDCPDVIVTGTTLTIPTDIPLSEICTVTVTSSTGRTGTTTFAIDIAAGPVFDKPGTGTVNLRARVGRTLNFTVKAISPDGLDLDLDADTTVRNLTYRPALPTSGTGEVQTVGRFRPKRGQAGRTFTIVYTATDSNGCTATLTVNIRVRR